MEKCARLLVRTLFIIWFIGTISLYSYDQGRKEEAGCPEQQIPFVLALSWPIAVIAVGMGYRGSKSPTCGISNE